MAARTDDSWYGRGTRFADIQSMRVLVLEDDPATRAALENYLGRTGFEVRAAGSVSEALTLSGDYEPDVLLSDWNLGGRETAFPLIQKLLSGDPRLPVVINSGRPAEEFEPLLDELGAHFAVVPKPSPLRRIVEALERGADTREAD